LQVAIQAAQAGTDIATAQAAVTGSSAGNMGGGEAVVAAVGAFFAGSRHGMVKAWDMIHNTPRSSPTATAPPTTATLDAHAQKKQSTGSRTKSGDNHMRQYKNYKKGNKKNKNQRKGAGDRRNASKPKDSS
jgi:hypothetical protein